MNARSSKPWSYGPGDEAARVTSRAGNLVATCHLHDAPLIAAAPDLLEAVLLGVKWARAEADFDKDDSSKNARAVIEAAKAFQIAARDAVAKACPVLS